jgi:hypothetical protein
MSEDHFGSNMGEETRKLWHASQEAWRVISVIPPAPRPYNSNMMAIDVWFNLCDQCLHELCPATRENP